MIFKLKLRIMISALFIFLICGIGQTESEIPLVFKYELPVVNDRLYASHSVTFTHATHAMDYKITCVQCHHTLKPGAVAVKKNCVDCHENIELRRYMEAIYIIPEKERMDYHILAIHNQCINCHKETKRYGVVAKAPVACWGCHVRQKK